MKSYLYIFMRKFAIAAVAAFVALGSAVTGRAQTTVIQPGVSAITPSVQQIETGPILDVVPDVLADGYTINLTLIPSLIEFSGYQTPPSLGSFSSTGLNVVLLPTALPEFSVREVTTTVNVWDGQTVVLGGLIEDEVQETKDEVPVLGDVPIIGRLFQSQTKNDTKRNLMIFVTPMMIDPAGNRVHSEDELPFAQNNTPTQPPPLPGQVEAPPPPSNMQ
ncbi:MAG TPA: type II and III secretion system protein [Verrucomicrobiae bacterium]|nr:type II and III secretion system protein [Verrucomicrobiae bacterium]